MLQPLVNEPAFDITFFGLAGNFSILLKVGFLQNAATA